MPRPLYLAQTRRLRAVLPKPRDISTRADARTWLVREGVAGRGAALALDLAAAAPAYASVGVNRPGHRSSSSHMKAGTGRNSSEGTRAQPRRTRRGGGECSSGACSASSRVRANILHYKYIAQARTRLDCDERLEKMREVNAKHHEWFSQHEGARPP